MKLQESPDDITNVLKEEAESSGAAGSSQAINRSDFSVDTLEVPKTEEKKQEVPVVPAAAAAAPEVEKKTTTEEKTTIGPNGEKVVEKVVIVSQPAASVKSEAVARLFNPNTALLMFDIFLTRFGGIFTPDRPREYWALTTQDKTDLSTLATESAKEEQWTGIPTKYLLFGALGLMIGGKVVYAKKTDYAFVPGEKPGDPKAKKDSSEKENSDAPKNDNDYKALFIREKARFEVEHGVKNNSEEINELKKQNEYLLQLIEKATGKSAGKRISDVDFEEVRKETKHQPVHNEAGDYIFKDSQGREWNLDKMEFSPNDAQVDRTKAGFNGWANNGIKLGAISAGQHEAAAEWRKYRKQQKAAA